MIYLIGGTPRSGKSIVAKKLSEVLRIPWVSGDSLEGIPKKYTAKNMYAKKFPKHVMRIKTHQSNELMYSRYSASNIVEAYTTQAASVWEAIELFIDSLIVEKQDFIIEGYQIPVAAAAKLQKRYPNDVSIIFLIKTDPEKIIEGTLKHNNPDDWFVKKSQSPLVYPKIAAMLSRYGKKIEHDAKKFNLPLVNTDTNFAAKIKKAVTLIKS